ncbi:MAG: hypothetical protein L0956_09175 [Candidatus Mariimomonas ferrooxydans]
MKKTGRSKNKNWTAREIEYYCKSAEQTLTKIKERFRYMEGKTALKGTIK